MFDNNLKKLAKGKTLGPDIILKKILKAVHSSFHDMFFFWQYYHESFLVEPWVFPDCALA